MPGPPVIQEPHAFSRINDILQTAQWRLLWRWNATFHFLAFCMSESEMENNGKWELCFTASHNQEERRLQRAYTNDICVTFLVVLLRDSISIFLYKSMSANMSPADHVDHHHIHHRHHRHRLYRHCFHRLHHQQHYWDPCQRRSQSRG